VLNLVLTQSPRACRFLKVYNQKVLISPKSNGHFVTMVTKIEALLISIFTIQGIQCHWINLADWLGLINHKEAEALSHTFPKGY
jgi:hypothetical protein